MRMWSMIFERSSYDIRVGSMGRTPVAVILTRGRAGNVDDFDLIIKKSGWKQLKRDGFVG